MKKFKSLSEFIHDAAEEEKQAIYEATIEEAIMEQTGKFDKFSG